MISDEKRADLEEAVAEMRMLAETVKTAGWQKVLLLGFANLREGYMAELMNAKDLPSMFKAQSAIKSIDMLTGEVDRRIQEGKEAVEILSKEKEKK